MIRIVSGFLFIAFLSSCLGLKDLEVKEVKGFSLKKLDPSGMQSSLQLSILNPNRFGFVILPSTFDVKYSGIYLGKAKLVKKVKIKGKEEHTYTFELENDFKEVNFLDLLNLLQPGGFKNEINIKGELKASKFLMRKKFRVDYKEKVSLN
jgi:LEA14-like dessication related protein